MKTAEKLQAFPTRRTGAASWGLAVLTAALFLSAGCAAIGDAGRTGDRAMKRPKDRIVRTAPRGPEPVLFEEMIDDLADARVVYVGEQHRRVAHHRIQLRIIKALHERHPDLKVGMEMFSRPYQPVLNDWSAGILDQEAFLKSSHWYANWKFDYDLYESILRYVRENGLPLIALNIPFHIPPKIAVGGIDTLLPGERQYLPAEIKTDDPGHRAYLEEVYEAHRAMLKGRDDFENFYMAQNVWEDVMAESVADNLDDAHMVVIIGNGHIQRRFGVPERAYDRTGAPYRTVLTDPGPGPAEPEMGDYIWRTFMPGAKPPGK
jgi:uncharacterized iron-regulated protein